MNAKLELMQSQFDHSREMDRLSGQITEKNKNPWPEKMDKWVDYGIMKAIGMNPETLFKFQEMYGPEGGALAGPPKVPVSGPQQQQGSEVDPQGYEVSFSQDQANELNSIIVTLDKKGIPFAKIKGILEAMRDKPHMIDIALQFVNTNN